MTKERDDLVKAVKDAIRGTGADYEDAVDDAHAVVDVVVEACAKVAESRINHRRTFVADEAEVSRLNNESKSIATAIRALKSGPST